MYILLYIYLLFEEICVDFESDIENKSNDPYCIHNCGVAFTGSKGPEMVFFHF